VKTQLGKHVAKKKTRYVGKDIQKEYCSRYIQAR